MVVYKVIFTKNLYCKPYSDTDENGQKCLFCIQTVGRVKYRYRLVHRWVAEMLLNVQSEFFFVYSKTKHKALYCIKLQSLV